MEQQPDQQPLIPHLFRTEYRKIVSVLCKRFGFRQMEIAEDIASETFLIATYSWGLDGPPPNPTAWLYHVAANKAKTLLQRDELFRTRISPAIKHADQEASDIDLSADSIRDSQLQMMFAICHPSIPPESQIGLSLRILCGFGIEEIADAFLTSKEVVNKRLYRAREKLREEKIPIEMPPPAEMEARLGAVLTTIYLLFNEGYYSESRNEILRKDLCLEAVRLCHLLTEVPLTDRPEVSALLALMCFHASRFDARIDQNGEIILYDDQDTSLWNRELITQGALYLTRAAQGERLSTYHLEAMIAFWSTRRTDEPEKWENLLHLYDRLLAIAYSPIAAFNRTYALAKVRGKEAAIAAAEQLRLTGNPFYYSLLGELYTGIDDRKAVEHYRAALALARTEADKRAIQKKIDRF